MPSARLGRLAWATCFCPRDTSLQRKDLWEIKYDRSDGIVGIAQLFATPLSVQTTVPARFQPTNNIPVRPSQPFGIIVFVVVMVTSIPSSQEAHSTSSRRLGLAPPKRPKDPSRCQRGYDQSPHRALHLRIIRPSSRVIDWWRWWWWRRREVCMPQPGRACVCPRGISLTRTDVSMTRTLRHFVKPP